MLTATCVLGWLHSAGAQDAGEQTASGDTSVFGPLSNPVLEKAHQHHNYRAITEELERLYQQYKKTKGPAADETIDSLSLLANYWHYMGYYHQAADANKALLRVQRRRAGENHRRVYLLHMSMANNYLEAGLYKEAGDQLQQAEKLMSANDSVTKEDRALWQLNRGKLYFGTGKHKAAVKHYRQGLQQLISAKSAGDSLVYYSYGDLALILLADGQHAEALDPLGQYKMFYEKHCDSDPYCYKDYYIKLARFYETLQKTEPARHYYKKFIQVFEPKFGSSNPLVEKYREKVNSLK